MYVHTYFRDLVLNLYICNWKKAKCAKTILFVEKRMFIYVEHNIVQTKKKFIRQYKAMIMCNLTQKDNMVKLFFLFSKAFHIKNTDVCITTTSKMYKCVNTAIKAL